MNQQTVRALQLGTLDIEMPIPIDKNLPFDIFMTLETRFSAAKVNSLFTKQGWSSRMCSWYEYEITSDVAELVIAPNQHRSILISGVINRESNSLDQILAILTDAGISPAFEVFDENDQLIRSNS